MRTVGRLARVTIDVEDVAVAVNFWSRLIGLAPRPSECRDEWVELESTALGRSGLVLTIRRADGGKPPEPNRAHLDITVEDIDVALEQVEALGGRRKQEPSVYPRPHSPIPGPVQIDWVVALDPFGNELCLIREIEDVERSALERQALEGPAPDATWRAVARAARYAGTAARQLSEPLPELGKGVGFLRCCVINVDDLAVGLQFWSALIGVPPISSEWPFRFAYLGEEDDLTETWRHQLILQRSSVASGDDPDRVHYDVAVADLDVAVSQLLWMGARVVRPADHDAALARAHPVDPSSRVVMSDRAGNQFCLVLEALPSHSTS